MSSPPSSWGDLCLKRMREGGHELVSFLTLCKPLSVMMVIRRAVLNTSQGYCGIECDNTCWNTMDFKAFRSVQFSRSVVSDSATSWTEAHQASPEPTQTPCPWSRWCRSATSSSVVPFSSRLPSLPALGSFQMSQFCASGGQSIGIWASAPVLPMNTQDWSPLGWTGWISLQSKGLSRVFSNPTAQNHQFFGFL